MPAVTPFEVDGQRAELHQLSPEGPPSYEGASPDWEHGVPFGAFTAYAVMVDGERVGVVAKIRTSSHRKSGRIIMQTFHPTRWLAQLADYKRNHRTGEWSRGYDSGEDGRVGYQHYTRADAAVALVRRWHDVKRELS